MNRKFEKFLPPTRIKSSDVKIQEMLFGYLAAPFCAMIANAIFASYLNRYYVDVLGWTKFGVFAALLPMVSSFVVILGNLMVGQWIDNTRTTAGKARPYLLLSVPLVAVAILLMFMTPTGANSGIQMIWIAVSYNLYYALAYPCYYTAHSSLVSLSTRDANQRGLLATLSNASTVAAAGVGASILAPILLQPFMFVSGANGLDIAASYRNWRILSVAFALLSAAGIVYKRTDHGREFAFKCKSGKNSHVKAYSGLYGRSILVAGDFIYFNLPVRTALQKQFDEFLYPLDV